MMKINMESLVVRTLKLGGGLSLTELAQVWSPQLESLVSALENDIAAGRITVEKRTFHLPGLTNYHMPTESGRPGKVKPSEDLDNEIMAYIDDAYGSKEWTLNKVLKGLGWSPNKAVYIRDCIERMEQEKRVVKSRESKYMGKSFWYYKLA